MAIAAAWKAVVQKWAQGFESLTLLQILKCKIMHTHSILEIDIANSIIKEEFFLVSRSPRGYLQVQDSRGTIVCNRITYDSRRSTILLG